MCGIAGMLLYSGTPEKSRLQRAARRLQHRGPDGSGMFIQEGIGLVHTRLSIIDLEGGAQPLHSADRRHHLVANGEIYNYPELRSTWDTQGEIPQSNSDCECILQAWRRAGTQGIAELHGMFAFALYDAKEQQLVLGRDRSGIKPLFYCRISTGLFFASELKALLALLPHTPELDIPNLSQALNYQCSIGRHTVLQGIKRLLPGEILQIDRREQNKRHFWQLRELPLQIADRKTAELQFESLFSGIMHEHVRADVPFGLFLSGGIDSGMLLSQLHKIAGSGVPAWSLGFDNTHMDDEIEAAGILARHFSARHHVLRIGPQQLFDAFVHCCWATDEPMRDYACLPTLLLAHEAGKECKVVFSGEGGDEAFAGYRRYRFGLEARIKHLLFGAGGHRAGKKWAKYLLKNELLHTQPRASFVELWDTAPAHWSWMQKSQYVDIRTMLADNLLVKTDRMLMSAGVEGRVPFSDHRLLEFGLSLPDAWKYHGRHGKQFLRAQARGILPDMILQRPKRGFYVPVTEWLSGPFLDRIEKATLQSKLLGNYFHHKQLPRLFAEQRRKGGRNREIWSLMQLAIWHRLLFEVPDETPSLREDPIAWMVSG